MCDYLGRTREQSTEAGSIGVVERYSKSTMSDSIYRDVSRVISSFRVSFIILLIYISMKLSKGKFYMIR